MADAYKAKVYVDYIPLETEFTFNEGEKIVIIGENGAGKTSLVESLYGTRGAANLFKLMEDREKAIKNFTSNFAFLPQNPEYNPNLSVKEIFKLFKSKLPKSLLEKTGITSYSKLTHLSGGQIKLVLLTVILNSPKPWVILDEPLSNLDSSRRFEALKIIASNQKTIFLVSHFQEAIEIADRIILIKNKEVHTLDIANSSTKRIREFFKRFKVEFASRNLILPQIRQNNFVISLAIESWLDFKFLEKLVPLFSKIKVFSNTFTEDQLKKLVKFSERVVIAPPEENDIVITSKQLKSTKNSPANKLKSSKQIILVDEKTSLLELIQKIEYLFKSV